MSERTPDLLDLLAHTDYPMPQVPDGLVLGWRNTNPDLRSRDGFQWAWPGSWTEALDDGRDLSTDHPDEPCPSTTLGGICVARTWSGARSGGVSSAVCMLLAYMPGDVLGSDQNKLRVRRALSLAVVDVARLVRSANLWGANLGGADLRGANLWDANLWDANLRGANLRGANLWDANLRDANLRDADLRGANLGGANLGGANLRDADLRGANLGGANLGGANLRGADLWDANLWGANLWDANLRGADLWDANLRGADLGGADLRGANLGGANLGGANLRGADLRDANANDWTLPPTGWVVSNGRIVKAEQ